MWAGCEDLDGETARGWVLGGGRGEKETDGERVSVFLGAIKGLIVN